jgi:hypothetical protein
VHGVNCRFRVTHPFHPLRGREFDLLDERWSWGKHWLYCSEEDGRLFCLPSSWTDRAEADPFLVVSAGRAKVRVEDLLRLVELFARR